MQHEAFDTAIRRLVHNAGLGEVSAIHRLAGGRNNQVYRVETGSGPRLVKRYFRNGDWDRQATESRFLEFAAEHSVERVPSLLAEDRENGLAVHSWIEGVPVTSGDLDWGICEAAAFLGSLASSSRKENSAAMPPARDACLSLADYFRSPRERMDSLAHALDTAPDSPVICAARAFFTKYMRPAWQQARDTVCSKLSNAELEKPLERDALIVSPSDFGFHNALRCEDNRLAFVDFEYAGLDDPAKAIGDFVCQADFCVPEDSLSVLASGIFSDKGAIRALIDKVTTLLPLFRIKFCCIILNDFKSGDLLRRVFAGAGQPDAHCMHQLEKAENYLARWRT